MRNATPCASISMPHNAAALQEFGVQRLGVSHCTGMPAAMMLAQQLGDALFFNNAGTRITVPQW